MEKKKKRKINSVILNFFINLDLMQDLSQFPPLFMHDKKQLLKILTQEHFSGKRICISSLRHDSSKFKKKKCKKRGNFCLIISFSSPQHCFIFHIPDIKWNFIKFYTSFNIAFTE